MVNNLQFNKCFLVVLLKIKLPHHYTLHLILHHYRPNSHSGKQTAKYANPFVLSSNLVMTLNLIDRLAYDRQSSTIWD